MQRTENIFSSDEKEKFTRKDKDVTPTDVSNLSTPPSYGDTATKNVFDYIDNITTVV